MSDKKRTTVTTIETHEVWIVRKGVTEVPGEPEMLLPGEIAQPTHSVETNEPNKDEES